MIKQSVRVSSTTKKRIKQLAISPRESYEEIINRILDAKLGNMKITYKISDNYTSLYATIDYDKLEPNILFTYKEETYTNLLDVPMSIKFKKQIHRLPLFSILPLLESSECVEYENIMLRNVTGDMR